MQDDLVIQARRIVAKAWADEGFNARLLADPEAALKGERVAVPAGVKLVVHEDTAATRHLILPQKPDGELADAALDEMAAVGGTFKRSLVENFSFSLQTDETGKLRGRGL